MRVQGKHRVVYVPSLNGYGHIRRGIAILDSLIRRGFQCTLLLNSQILYPDWIKHEVAQRNIDLLLMNSPLSVEGPSIRRKDFISTEMCFEKVDEYDLVISDTVSWPLNLGKKSIWIAQFCWELYYQKTEGKDWKVQFDKIPSNVPIFSMDLFSWEEMSSFRNLCKIPVLDYWGLSRKRNLHNDELLLSVSGTADQYSRVDETLDLLPRLNGLEGYINSQGVKPAGVVCRAGLGIVSECISAQVPLIFLNDEDYEIKFNRSRLREIGISLDWDALKTLSYDKRMDMIKNHKTQVAWPSILDVDDFVSNCLLEAV